MSPILQDDALILNYCQDFTNYKMRVNLAILEQVENILMILPHLL